MIDKVKVLNVIQESLKNSEDKFLVALKITADNRIFVDIDGDNGINIDDCIELSRQIEGSLDREVEDFELNVASAGLDSPLRLPRQYKKNIGRDISVTYLDGEKVEGELVEATDEGCTVQPKGSKKKAAPEAVKIRYEEMKVAKIMVKF